MRALLSVLAVAMALTPGAISSSIKLTYADVTESSTDYSLVGIPSNSPLSALATSDILSASDPVSESTSLHASSQHTSAKPVPVPAPAPVLSQTSALSSLDTSTESYSTTTTPPSASSSSPFSLSETRFQCLYPDGTSDLYAEQINGKSTVFKCLAGTKCYQASEQYANVKCAYPKDQKDTAATTSSETIISSSSSGISSSSGMSTTFMSGSELGQTDLGFHNNRFAQVPLESILRSLSLSVTPTAEDHTQTIPTSSEPRVISVNVVLPTFAIKITEDPNALGMATVLSIDPNSEATSATQMLETSDDALSVAKDPLFLTVDTTDFSSLSTVQVSTTPAAPVTTATTTVTATVETEMRSSASSTKPIPIFGTPEIATKKAFGRIALDMDTPSITATTDQPEFTQSIVTRAGSRNRANGRQRHEITIDDYDLAGILRMTNLASLASQLLLSSGISDLAAFEQPTVTPALYGGPIFTVPEFPALSLPLPPLHAASESPLAAVSSGLQPLLSLAPQAPPAHPPTRPPPTRPPPIRPPPPPPIRPPPPPPSHTGPPFQPTPQPPPPSHTGPPVQPTPQPPPPSHTGPPVQPTPQPPPPSLTSPPVQPTLLPPPLPSFTGPPAPMSPLSPLLPTQLPLAPLQTGPQPPIGPYRPYGLPDYSRPSPQLNFWPNVPMDVSQVQEPVPLPQPLPLPQMSDPIRSLPDTQQTASGADPALSWQIPTTARQPIIPVSSSPFNIMSPLNTQVPPSAMVSMPPESIAPLIMQDTNTAIYTPIIPFITDGTRRETPTSHAVAANESKGGINASGIASILQDVLHIPPSAISIDGKPMGAGGSSSHNKDNRKDGDSDSDDDGDNEGNSDDEDAGSDVQGEPQDLEKELQSRLGIEMNKNRNKDRFHAHIKIVGASIKNKGRHVDIVKGNVKSKVKNRFRGMVSGKSKPKHRGSTLMVVDSDSDSSDDDMSSDNLSLSTSSQRSSTRDNSLDTVDEAVSTPTAISDSGSNSDADVASEDSSTAEKDSIRNSSSADKVDDQSSKFEMVIENESDSSSAV
ncbi:hypothetical protein FB645_002417 [Coemansia sp. IMI 203386]|nr:hypothetical protein FB645_002417 [Coemansia sp. IMI 203386]